MKRICILGALILIFMVYSKLTQAQPGFSGAIRKPGVVLFRDVKQQSVCHYLPVNQEIGKYADGRQHLNFIMMPYTGLRSDDGMKKSSGKRAANTKSLFADTILTIVS